MACSVCQKGFSNIQDLEVFISTLFFVKIPRKFYLVVRKFDKNKNQDFYSGLPDKFSILIIPIKQLRLLDHLKWYQL